jgi:pimeloyl-ACP methyl ester carboxylesterase
MPEMQLAVEERGTGPQTLLLVHGLGASRDHLHAVADALDGRFRTVLPDLPGHGDSPPGEAGHSLDQYVDDLRPLLLAAAPAVVCGLSFGADLARLLWNAEPDAVAGVALVEPLLDAEPLHRWAADNARSVIAPYLERDFERLVALMAEYPLTADLDEAARVLNACSHLRADEATLRGTLRIFGLGEALPGRPARSAAHVVVARASRSPVCPERAAAALASELGGEVVELDCGHCVALAAPQLLADALAASFANGS